MPGSPGEDSGRAREKAPEASLRDLSSRNGAHQTPSSLAHLPGPRAGEAGERSSGMPPHLSTQGGRRLQSPHSYLKNKKKKKSKPARVTEIQRQFLPLDRRTMFSRNVFCGATSPRRPPAMVILPTVRALGASGAVSHRSRRPGAQAAKVPGSTRPMRPAAPERRGGGWLPLPPSLRSAPPRCGPPGCALECPGLGAPRPPPVGGGSQPVQGAPYRARIPRGPSRSPEPRGEARTRAAPSGHSGKCVQSAPGAGC